MDRYIKKVEARLYKDIKNKKGWLTDNELDFLLCVHKNAIKRGE